MTLAADRGAEKEPEPERDAERRHGVAPDGGLHRGYGFARLVLRALDLMLTASLELAGKRPSVARCLAISWISSLRAWWLGISASFEAMSSSLPASGVCFGAAHYIYVPS